MLPIPNRNMIAALMMVAVVSSAPQVSAAESPLLINEVASEEFVGRAYLSEMDEITSNGTAELQRFGQAMPQAQRTTITTW